MPLRRTLFDIVDGDHGLFASRLGGRILIFATPTALFSHFLYGFFRLSSGRFIGGRRIIASYGGFTTGGLKIINYLTLLGIGVLI
jgi:hypothetical protein